MVEISNAANRQITDHLGFAASMLGQEMRRTEK